MSSFDANSLYWPCFKDLHDHVQKVKHEPDAADVDAFQAQLKEYESWLSKGLLGFKTPSSTSRKAVEDGLTLTASSTKLPVDPELKQAALEVSGALNLDEIQTYILVHRWHATVKGLSDASPLVGRRLSSLQLSAVTDVFRLERLSLLQAIEGLLWLGEGAAGEGPLAEAVEDTLKSLVAASPGLEQAAYTALETSLQGDRASHPWIIPGGLTATEIVSMERNVLLTILTLIYFYPRKQCTPDRFLDMAKLFNARLFHPLPRAAIPSGKSNGDEHCPSPSQLTVKLADFLLLEIIMFGVNKLLTALTEGRPINQDDCAFLEAGIKQRVDAELRGWWPTAGPAQAPILLAWSALLCLVSKSGNSNMGAGYAEHAEVAYHAGALPAMCNLSSHAGLLLLPAEMLAEVTISTMSAVLTAFGLDPSSIPLQQTMQLVTVLANAFTNHPRLSKSFWVPELVDELTYLPIYHYLEDLGALFPAIPIPFLTLLAALADGPDSAGTTNAFLAHLPRLCCLHVLPDAAITQSPDAQGQTTMVITGQELKLPGSKVLTLSPGVTGEVTSLPEGAAGAAWTAPPDADVENLRLIRWKLPLLENDGLRVLLCRTREALKAARHSPAAAEELGAVLHVLGKICRHDSRAAGQLLLIEVPMTEQLMDEQQPPLDSLSIAADMIGALVDLPHPLSPAVADCMAICTALAQSVPQRVGEELLRALKLSSVVGSSSRNIGSGGNSQPNATQDIEPLSRLISSEGFAGSFPATLALLKLIQALLTAPGVPDLTPIVLFVLHRVLPHVQHWQYKDAAERWNIAAAGLQVVRQALLCTESPVSRAVHATLSFDVGMASCLFPVLPPDAATLQNMQLTVHGNHVIDAIELCCVAWLRLIPVLLPPSSPELALAPSSFFTHRPGAAEHAAPAAAVLLSYLTYSYLTEQQRAHVLRSMHCLAVAAARSAPAVAFVKLCPLAEDGSLSPSVRSLLIRALDASTATVRRDLFTAACDVLIEGARSHPSLTQELMFPSLMATAIMKTIKDKENKAGNTGSTSAETKKAQADSTAQGTTLFPAERDGSSTEDKEPSPSCLDALWTLVQQAPALLDAKPLVAARALQVLAAMWQSQGAAHLPMSFLQAQGAALWEALTAVVEKAGSAGEISLAELDTTRNAGTGNVAGNSGGQVHEDNGVDGASEQQQQHGVAITLAGKESMLWTVAAEAAALQILVAECYLWAAGGQVHEMPAALSKFSSSMTSSALCSTLLGRYCKVLPTTTALTRLDRHAAAAGCQLLAAALTDDVLSMHALKYTHGMLSELHAAGLPLLRGSSQDSARLLNNISNALLTSTPDPLYSPFLPADGFNILVHGRQLSSEHSAALAAVASVVLKQAEAPSRVAASREPGRGFIFDEQMLSRRCAPIAASLGGFYELRPWLDAISVLASLEDARLEAAVALRALCAVEEKLARAIAKSNLKNQVQGGSGGLNTAIATTTAVHTGGLVGGDVVDDCLGVAVGAVGVVLQELSRQYQQQQQQQNGGDGSEASAASKSAVDVHGVHVSALSEAVQVYLLKLRRYLAPFTSSSSSSSSSEASPSLSEPLLSLCGCTLVLLSDWMVVVEGLNGAQQAQQEMPRITANLLTAGLLLVMNINGGSDPSPSGQEAMLSRKWQDVQTSAARLLPSLLSCLHYHSTHSTPHLSSSTYKRGTSPHTSHVVSVASLITALMDKVLPPPMWLPALNKDLHLGGLLAWALSHAISSTKAASQNALGDNFISNIGSGNGNGAPIRGGDTIGGRMKERKGVELLLLPWSSGGDGQVAMDLVPASATTVAAGSFQHSQQDGGMFAVQNQSQEESVEEAILLLILQVAREPPGAHLLVEQGVLEGVLRLAKWILAPEGGDLMGESPHLSLGSVQPKPALVGVVGYTRPGSPIDYANAYTQDGAANTVQKLWCSVLTLAGVFMASLPGHSGVEGAVLQLAVVAFDRVQLAVSPPEGSGQQPLTLAMAQETKYTLFLLCTLSRLTGEWRMVMPDALPMLRCASAVLLSFLSQPVSVQCGPVSVGEKESANQGNTDVATCAALGSGWFGALAESVASTSTRLGDNPSNNNKSMSSGACCAGSYAWQLAERLYSCMQYALAFQLAVASEVSEQEEGLLGPMWVTPTTLAGIQSQCLELAEHICESGSPEKLPVLRSVMAALDVSSQLMELMCCGMEPQHVRKVQEQLLQGSMVLSRHCGVN